MHSWHAKGIKLSDMHRKNKQGAGGGNPNPKKRRFSDDSDENDDESDEQSSLHNNFKRSNIQALGFS